MLSRLFWSVVVIVLAAIALRMYVVDIVRVEGNDMAPALLDGDLLLVNRRFGTLDRGDVVLVRHPREPDRLIVRRVVAVEPDRVEVRDGRLVLNRRPSEHRRVGDVLLRRTGRDGLDDAAYGLEIETLGDRTMRTLRRRDAVARSAEERGVAGGIYVLGDNRTDAEDSRGFGLVDVRSVRGTVWMVLAASDHAGPAFDPEERRFSFVR